MIGLDTSVVVRLLVGQPADQALRARRRLAAAQASRTPALVSDLVVGESYFALRHHYAVPSAEAVAALRLLLRDPAVRPTGAAPRVLAELAAEEVPPGIMDRLIHADYEDTGAALITFDQKAARLEGAELLAG